MNPFGSLLLPAALLTSGPAQVPAALFDTPPWIPDAPRPAPPASTGHLESQTYPIRVFYSDDAQLAYAEKVLSAAEDAWKRQVEDLGYPEPWTGGDEQPVQQGLWLYVATVGTGGGAYTRPLADIPSTPRADCSCRVVIDPLNSPFYIPQLTDHEFNHATQLAMECAEATSVYEMFATASTYLAMPDVGYFTGSFLDAFQAKPEFSLDYWTRFNPPEKPGLLYNYGAALFPIFLQERYGEAEPGLLADLFGRFAQEGTITVLATGGKSDKPNTPDWFEGVDALMQEKGTNFDGAFDEFAAWRAIVGEYDDGAHFEHGTDYSPPALSASVTPDLLPQGESFAVYEYGTRYVELLPIGTNAGLLVRIDTDDPQRTWGGSLLLWREATPVEVLPITFNQGAAELEVASLASVDRVLLVISHHSDGVHDPDEQEYDTTATFSYSLALMEQSEADGGVPAYDAGADEGSSLPAEGANDEAGCGCVTAGAPTSRSVLGWLVGCLAAAVCLRLRR